MRRLGLGIAAALALLAPPAGAQALDEVLAKHAAAHGGLERWRAVQSLRVTGTEVTFSNAAPFLYEWRRPDSFRFEQSMIGKKVTVAHDGTVTWWIHPVLEIEQPAAVPEDKAAYVRRFYEIDCPLMDATAKGNKVELLGQEDLDGEPALKLEVTRKDGAKETWYLDPKSFLERARFDRTIDLPDPKDRWTYYSDFRTVDGLVIPHRQEQEYSIRHVALTVEKLEINPEIDPGRFALPAAKAPASAP